MKKLHTFFAALCLLVASDTFSQVPFTPGNIVVCRVGDGVNTLNTGSNATISVPVFLDEYTYSGTLVQSIPMPTAGVGPQKTFTLGGLYAAPTNLNLSVDGQYLTVAGFNTPPGTSNFHITAAVEKTIAAIKYDGTVNTTTSLTDFARLARPVSVVSTNGTDFWCSGNGVSTTDGTQGVKYTSVGSSTSIQLSTTPADFIGLTIANGQLYGSRTGGSRLYVIGSGLPKTSGQSITSLPGFPDLSQAINQFAFADMNPNIPGVDVLYAANFNSGIEKYSLVSGAWVLNGTIGTATDFYMGLAADISGSAVKLFSIRNGANGGPSPGLRIYGGDVVTITDASGYNGAFTGSVSVVASCAPVNYKSFRGVALVPKKAAANQTITFADVTKVYGDADFNPASASSSLPISYTSSNTAVASVVNGKLHITGSGTSTITANQPGNPAVNPAPPVSRTLTVNKAALTVTADNKNKVPGEVVPALTLTYTGFVNGESNSVLTTQPTLSTTATTNSPLGSYPITVSGAAAANYTITQVNGTLTVSAVPAVNSIVLAYFPTSSTLSIQVLAGVAQRAAIQVLDVSGRVLLTKDIDLRQGLHFYTLPAGNLGRGGYVVRVLGNNLKIHANIIKSDN